MGNHLATVRKRQVHARKENELRHGSKELMQNTAASMENCRSSLKIQQSHSGTNLGLKVKELSILSCELSSYRNKSNVSQQIIKLKKCSTQWNTIQSCKEKHGHFHHYTQNRKPLHYIKSGIEGQLFLVVIDM